MSRSSYFAFVLCLAALASLRSAEANVFGNTYKLRDKVPVIVNNVGPFNNPAETYEYYSLPFCAPKKLKSRDENLGEVLAGDRRTTSLYDIRYKVDNDWVLLCRFNLNQNEIKWFSDAIRKQYMFEMFVDELPVRGFVGETETISIHDELHMHNTTYIYLFTHLDFSIAYNDNRVIAVNLTTDPQQRIRLEYGKDIEVQFSYSVHWRPTDVPYLSRLKLHQSSAIGEQSLEIHWLSIVNSFVLVLMLTALLGIIFVRAMKKDIARFVEDDEAGAEAGDDEEGGWKLIHGDVFRPPSNIMLFSAAVGTGAQIFAMTVSILALSLLGTFYPGNRGALYTAALMLYALTAGIAGHVSTSLYLQLGGEKWANNAVLTACLFAVPCLGVFSLNNSVAIAYGSTAALPFGTIFVIALLWALVTFPLTIIGSMRARKLATPFDAPCKTNKSERQIPELPFYRSPWVQVLTAGFLPFSAIYIELHYIFISIFGHGVYTLFGILCLAFSLLIIVTAFITVALTYFQLAAEDYHWWWRCFLSGGSTGFFIYAYAVFFFNYRSNMSGALQGSFFFGYMGLVSYAFFLMLGSVGYYVTQKVVRYLYLSIKVD